MLRPAPMKRIAVLAPREVRQQVLSVLHDMGVVQVEPLSKEALSFLRSEADDPQVREVSDELLRIRSLKAALPPSQVKEKRRFTSLGDLFAASRSIDVDAEVSMLKQREEKLLSELDNISDRLSLARGLDFIDADLNVFDLGSAKSFLGVVPAERLQGLQEALVKSSPGALVRSKKDGDTARLVVVVPNDELEGFGSTAQRMDARFRPIPSMRGRPIEVATQLQQEQQKVRTELNQVLAELSKISSKYYGLIASVEEQLTIETKKTEVMSTLGYTESSFALEGWAPASKVGLLSDTLRRYAGEGALVLEIPSESRPPTLLENPRRLRYFESFIRFYSLPQPDEFDPTLIFAFTFPIFFGLMLGDVGYGLVILGVSFWIIRRVRHHGKTVVPLKLRKFARNIFKPPAFEKLAMAMIPGAVVGTVLGFLFNAYFGFPLNQYLFGYLNSVAHLGLPASGAFLEPTSQLGLKRLLLVSGYIGLFEVSLGLFIGILDGIWAHERRHSFGKLGWLFVAWGVALLGLTILHHGSVSPVQNPVSAAYIGMVVAGLGLIAYGEGAQALIELPSIISHIISYTRLVGILLASVILAVVIDDIFLGTLHGGPALVVGGVVILVFGQLFNLVLALFEPGIQGARLIYVEFFSKFYKGNGKRFTPFGGERVYTLSEIASPEQKRD